MTHRVAKMLQVSELIFGKSNLVMLSSAKGGLISGHQNTELLSFLADEELTTLPGVLKDFGTPLNPNPGPLHEFKG